MLLWATGFRTGWSPSRMGEAALLLLATVVLSQIVFGGVLFTRFQAHPLAFLYLPLFIWAAFRFDPRETAAVTLLLSGLALVGTLRGFGPFVRGPQHESLLLLQAFTGVMAVLTLSVGAEISQRRRTEAELRASEGRLSAIFDQTTVGIAQVDLTGRFTLVNDRYCEMVGRSREDLLRLRMQGLTHPEDLPRNLELFHRLAAGGENFPIEKRYLKPDGSYLWVHTSDLRAALAMLRDEVLVRERTQQLLAEAERLAHLGSWSWDLAGNTVTWSEELYRIFGLPSGRFGATYEAYLERVHPEDRGLVREAVEAVLRTGRPFEHRHRIVRPDGTERTLHSRGVVVKDAADRPSEGTAPART